MEISHPILPAILMLIAAGFTSAYALAQQPGNDRQQQLRRLLAEDCSVCHGKSLQGDLGPPLTSKSLAGKSEDQLVDTILEGHEETAMPPWWAMMEVHEARWLVRYLRNTAH